MRQLGDLCVLVPNAEATLPSFLISLKGSGPKRDFLVCPDAALLGGERFVISFPFILVKAQWGREACAIYRWKIGSSVFPGVFGTSRDKRDRVGRWTCTGPHWTERQSSSKRS